jgi:hypothetical protein
MTPTTFLRLLTATQAERDAAPCVAPVVGHLVIHRFGGSHFFIREDWFYHEKDGSVKNSPRMDIIATLDLQATLERLEELERATDAGML